MTDPFKVKRILIIICAVFVVGMGASLSSSIVSLINLFDMKVSPVAQQIYSDPQQASKKIATALVPTLNGMRLADWYQSDDDVKTDRRLTLRHQSESSMISEDDQQKPVSLFSVIVITTILVSIVLFTCFKLRLYRLVKSFMALVGLWG